MRNIEISKTLIDKIPDDTPNSETLEAFAKLDNGGGYSFSGTTEELFNELLED